MIVEVKVNELPESVADGTLLQWHKQPGEAVKSDEPLAEIETDKVVLEIAAPAAGMLGAQLRKPGDTVKRGDVLATIDAGVAVADAPAQGKPSPPARAESGPTGAPAKTPQTATKTAASTRREPTSPAATPTPATPAPAGATPAKAGDGDANLAPSVRRLLREHNLNATDITGSGPRGRITKQDVLRHLEHSPHLASKIGEAAPLVLLSESAQASPGEGLAARPTTRVKMSRLRARIAERMLEAQHNAAILTTFNEINMQALVDLRRNYRDAFLAEHGTKLGIVSFFVRACTEALLRYPIVNASLDGDEIVHHGYFDIGVAVSTPRGLVVPVLRDADRMSLADIERAIADFGARGETGALRIDELSGGTFTISNGGVFGSMLSTPILNSPQSAILGLHRVEQRPVAEADKVVIRPMMYVALSYDHRLVDGRDAVLFLVAVKELIEDPNRFVLKV
ncbi:MAG: 2-oxoglutarate dehydrogenase complex dihydrolipoyllysine-residue succinyltransferase [Deltaproteobacteria bacterium]|nr:2-oxoglutarate dehydrogenase complex dihydrolipoyllysine-residue succinyltransferase [Deltaproteobacteria bacterium]